jgi:hypothetical protein
MSTSGQPPETGFHFNSEASNELEAQAQRARQILERLAAAIAATEYGRPDHVQDLVEARHVRLAAEKLYGPAAANVAVEPSERRRVGAGVFISYATPDLDAAQELSALLQRAKVPCFLAKGSIEVSAEWSLTIWQAIRDSRVFLALVSEAFARSEWCQYEIGAALSEGRSIIPALLHGTSLPRILAPFQAATVQTAKQRRELVKHIKRMCDK